MSPCVGFRHPTTDEVIPLSEAPARLDADGVMPRSAVAAMVADLIGPKHKGPNLSPSLLVPETTCRRQVVGERFLDYIESPLRLWASLEGSIFHDAMARVGATLLDGTKVNIRMPADDDGTHKVTMEIFPGIPLSGEADEAFDFPDNTSNIVDHKTERYNPKDYTHERIPGWELQVNIYAEMYEQMTGRSVKELFVWKTFRGCPGGKNPFRKVPLGRRTREAIWKQIGPWATEFQAALTKAEEIRLCGGSVEEMQAHVASIRMDAFEDNHFSGWKCPNGCAIYGWCFRASGKVAF